MTSPDLWYRQPAPRWLAALPVGNGRLGASVFGRVYKETLIFNEETVWTRWPDDRNNPDALKALPEVRVFVAAATPVLVGALGILPVAAQPAPPAPAQSPIQDPGAVPPLAPPADTTPPPPIAYDDMPLVRIPPAYPPEALRARIEGAVRIQFTITIAGTVRDPVVVASNPPGVFDEAALEAIRRWRYRPHLVNGIAVDRAGVQTEIKFQLTE